MKGRKNTHDAVPPAPDPKRERTRRAMETLATFGLLLVAAGIAAPFINFGSGVWLLVFKWLYAAGAVAYAAARFTGSLGRDESFRVRRMRRLEFWAGVAFCIGAFFWFFNTRSFDGETLTFRMLNETILFTLVGALIQIVASWMLSSQLRKEQAMRDAASDKGGK